MEKSNKQFAFLNTLLNGQFDGFWDWPDVSKPQVWWSDNLYRLLGYEPGEIPPTFNTYLSLLHPSDTNRANNDLQNHLKNDIPYDTELRMRCKDGLYKWFRARGKAIRDEQGIAVHMSGIMSDISDKKSIELKLLEQNERLQLASDALKMGIWDYTAADNTLVWNDTLFEMFGVDKSTFKGTYQDFINCVCKEDRERVSYVVHDSINTKSRYDIEYTINHPRLGPRVIHAIGDVHTDENNDVKRLIGVCLDITNQRQIEDQLEYIANHDSLTNLPNRYSFLQKLSQQLKLCKLQEQPLALLYIDVDNFKKINDTHGHLFGDKCLLNLAKKLSQHLRDEEFFARMGGDEFTLICPNTDARPASHLAERLIQIAEEQTVLDGHLVKTHLTIGIALYPHAGDDSETLLKHADVALYKAKASGKNQYKLFTLEMSKAYRRQTILENALENAIAKNELHVVYHPQYDLITGDCVGAEVLSRWHHKHLGNISPAEFIPIAEEMNLIADIGLWCIRQALLESHEFLQSHPNFSLSINLSGVQLTNPATISRIIDFLDITGVDCKQLVFEITETALLENLEVATASMKRLNDIGIRFAIDDFGTGYCSFHYLRHLPVDILKIDQQFVADINPEYEDTAIIQAIIQLGKALDMSVTAEGIETDAQLNYLLKHGCNTGQGFHFAHPIKFHELKNVI